MTCLLFAGLVATAQEETDTTKVWTKGGNISFLVTQSTFNNWLAGGENNFSGNLGLNYDFNYKKNDWTWDNKIIAEYGILQTKNAEFEKKTTDRLEFNSLLGKKATGKWYYSAFLNFRTQFTDGYLYGKNETTGIEERDRNTTFMSPGYLTFGPGMLWKKSDNLKVNIAPATSKFTFVSDELRNEKYAGQDYFGVEEGKSMRYELGFYASGYYKFNIMENISMENILSLYSNYLEDPQNVDVDYQMNIVMKVNKYISANFTFHTIYDDNAFRGFQTRQVLGVGVNYGF